MVGTMLHKSEQFHNGEWFFSKENFCSDNKLRYIEQPLSTYAKYKLSITAARMIFHDKDEAPMLRVVR